ncbi:hypothetical protein BDV25DRAFT_168074 [Aspergillus avenaceus]|uniref:Homeobox protein meis n=1 Tax=Aspergillus avenaceus TaxID=36643 RepID=A0A5N6TRW1_ASPAV|nr:hypothetical protein BDV25DRAFT_168074 [Aspergillus avenaceus]
MERSSSESSKICDDVLLLPPLDAGPGIAAHPSSSQPLANSSLDNYESMSSVDSNTNLNRKGKARKRYRRLSTSQTKTLETWFYQHHDYPFPTEQERDQLRQQTGLEMSQISNWFTNARRRRLLTGDPSPEANSADNSLVSPLERWKNSPPESEPAATSDILRALDDVPYSSDSVSSNSSSASFVFGAPSMSSYEHSQASSSELSAGPPSRPFQRPPTPIHTKPRRFRRKPPHPTEALSKRKTQSQRPYQCTFCSDTFLTKYDWQRHEKSLHLSIDRWVCAPQGGIVEVDGMKLCAYCQAPDADTLHLESHNYHVCHGKPFAQRTFSRKDHLRQHLRLTHCVGYHPSMDKWREARTRLESRCGFCDAQLHTWEERVEHLAGHFKTGADMIQWRGGWGFDPDIQDLVENAMPAYLVGHERLTMDPWRTTDALGTGGDKILPTVMDVPNALNRYTNLKRDLIDYIRDQMLKGIQPTDQMVQDHARQIAYGSNDPWDQTYADDPRWVAALRQEAELTIAGTTHDRCVFTPSTFRA